MPAQCGIPSSAKPFGAIGYRECFFCRVGSAVSIYGFDRMFFLCAHGVGIKLTGKIFVVNL